MTQNNGSSVGKDSLRTFGAAVLSTGLGVLTGLVIARWLGPSGKGVYSGVQMIMQVAVSTTAGVGSAVTFFLTNQRRKLSELLPALGLVLFVISAAIWVGLGLWVHFHGATLPIVVFAVTVPAAVVVSWQMGVYIGLGKLRALAYQIIGSAALALVSIAVAVIALHLGIAGALACWAGTAYVAASVVVIQAVLAARGGPTAPLAGVLRAMSRFSAQMGINVFLGMLNYRIDSLILIGLLGPAAFGVYSIAVAVGELHFMISRSVTTAVTRDIGAQDRAASAAIVARVVRTCTALVGAVALVAFAVGPTLIAVVYGSRFSGAGGPLRLLLPGIVAFATMGTFASFFQYQLGRPTIVAYINMAMIAVQAAGCLVLVPVWGLGGAALASSATYIVGAMLNTCWFCRVTGTRAADLWVVRAQDLLWIKREVARLIAPRGYGASRPSTLATSPDRERTPILTKMRFK